MSLTSSALVLFSGGQDSTTCLFWAKKKFSKIEAVFFHYEQRHEIEFQSVKKITSEQNILCHELNVPAFREIGGTAMIDKIAIEDMENNIPNTFVPGRNIVFLTLAASLAYKRGLQDIVIGVNEADYSGYPDCRQDFIRSIEQSLCKGLNYSIRVHTPLQTLNKAEIWQLSDKLGVLDIIVNDSHTCYIGDHSTFHTWGYGCGECPACRLRQKGYEEFILGKSPVSQR